MTRFHSSPRERGVVLIITLITLLLLTIGAVAMVRSFDTSQVLAGNLSFRRDLTNQGERGIAKARKQLLSGVLGDITDPSANYSAKRLDTNGSGIPLVLLKDSEFERAGMPPKNDIEDKDSQVLVRYVIDRLCNAEGPFDEATCSGTEEDAEPGKDNRTISPAGEMRPVYRVTVRVDGPRSTQTYLQTTFVY
jgi:hypothetical protein